MKITRTFRVIYKELEPQFSFLKYYIDKMLEPICRSNDWLYNSRIKSIESFVLKYESDRKFGPDIFEDFFGCEIVTNNRSEVKTVQNILEEKGFKVIDQRPKEFGVTNIKPENFQFNELRLYVKYIQSPQLKPKEFLDNLFEIQVKTLLSYAWDRATHDLVYKTENVSWGKERVSFQIKALLEQAEYSINEIEKASENYFPIHNFYETKKKIVNILNDYWKGLLPKDLNRLSNNIINFLDLIKSNVGELEQVIINENREGRGSRTLNISPYQIIIKSYTLQKPDLLFKIPNYNNRNRLKIVITDEMDFNEDIIDYLKLKNRLIDLRLNND